MAAATATAAAMATITIFSSLVVKH
jgi:hypothetical protein